jgi:hypothetical protein
MPGWGGYQKPKKSQSEIDLERRRELGLRYYTPLEELQAIVAKSRVKVKKLPPVPEEPPKPVEAFTGPCQAHVQNFKKHRAAKAAGKLPVSAVEPYVDPVIARREASRVPGGSQRSPETPRRSTIHDKCYRLRQ